MFIVIAYDITDDRRRLKIATALEDYGTRVQKSVFECNLTNAQLTKLMKRLKKWIAEGDSVRYYKLCQPCRDQIIVEGKGEVTNDKSFYLA